MIKSVNTCLNCESLESALNCSKHNLSVQIDNVCDDHSMKKAFSKMSDCLSCLNFKKTNCPHPESAKYVMFFLDILLDLLLTHPHLKGYITFDSVLRLNCYLCVQLIF